MADYSGADGNGVVRTIYSNHDRWGRNTIKDEKNSCN